jgi:hypothetical protein
VFVSTAKKEGMSAKSKPEAALSRLQEFATEETAEFSKQEREEFYALLNNWLGHMEEEAELGEEEEEGEGYDFAEDVD